MSPQTMHKDRGLTVYICSAPIENLVLFWNRTTLLPSSGTGYPVLEPAAPFEHWTSTLVLRLGFRFKAQDSGFKVGNNYHIHMYIQWGVYLYVLAILIIASYKLMLLIIYGILWFLYGGGWVGNEEETSASFRTNVCN